MISKLVYINIGLALLSAFFLVKTYQVWQHDPLASFSEPGRPAGKPAAGNADVKRRKENRPPPRSLFREVTDKNLFSETREIYTPPPPEKEPEVVMEVPKVDGRQINLYGVILMKDYAKALINNPSPKPGEKPAIWVRKGDRIGQLKVTGIQKESIVLVGDGFKKYRIELHENKKRAKMAGASPASARPNVVVAQPAPAAPSKPKPSAGRNKRAKADDEYEIIDTPFGKFKQKKR